MTAASPSAALPLARVLGNAADAVAAMRAGASLTEALERCPADARPATQALAFHAMRWLGSAETLRQALVPKPPSPDVDALLLTTLALLWPAGEPPYAEHTLVDQAVAAMRKRSPHHGGLINAVLRRFLRERDALVASALRKPLARYNHPAWWVVRLKADWPERWEQILDADNTRPPMTLRVNARRSSAAAYVERLAASGMPARALAGQAVVLDRPVPVTRLPGFAEGDVSVQDAAAQRAVQLLLDACLGPGARVLDACAAPGGKTAQWLEGADVDLTAIDSSAIRLARVGDTLERLGLTATTLAADAGNPAAWWNGVPFDAILLDAPCSASGIVRRHPDVRWLRRATDIGALVKIQARLLDALWPLLKPGGKLLYCTCSVFKDEGQQQIDAFLQRNRDARHAQQPHAPGHLLPLPDNRTPPRPDGHAAVGDGFFLALIDKP